MSNDYVNWSTAPDFVPKKCRKPFRSETYSPRFGDIIHCRSSGTSSGCGETFVVLAGDETGLDVLLLGRRNTVYVSHCHIKSTSAWHLAEQYAPEEE